MSQASNLKSLALVGMLALASLAGCLASNTPSTASNDGPHDQDPNDTTPTVTSVHHEGRFSAWTQPSQFAPGLQLPGTSGPTSQTTWNYTFFYIEPTTDNRTPATITATWTAHQPVTEELNLTLHAWDPYSYETSHRAASPLTLNHTLEPTETYRVQLHLPEETDAKLDIAWNITVQGAVDKVRP